TWLRSRHDVRACSSAPMAAELRSSTSACDELAIRAPGQGLAVPRPDEARREAPSPKKNKIEESVVAVTRCGQVRNMWASVALSSRSRQSGRAACPRVAQLSTALAEEIDRALSIL